MNSQIIENIMTASIRHIRFIRECENELTLSKLEIYTNFLIKKCNKVKLFDLSLLLLKELSQMKTLLFLKNIDKIEDKRRLINGI